MTDMRMWETTTHNGKPVLEGVVLGRLPGMPEEACSPYVDLTIRTSPIRRFIVIGGATVAMTENSAYRLVGPSRADLIRQASG